VAHTKRMRTLAVGIAAALTTVALGLVPSAVAGGQITGAGSTLVAPLEAKWATAFQSSTGISVVYGAVGSGTGISEITARTVNFGASDAPLTSAQATACGSCIQIPWALTATGIAFHVNGVSKLRLTPTLLAEIWLGQITNWDSPAIAKVNPGVKLPNLAITPVYRTDGSGDTYAFTNLLSDISPTWASKVGNATTVSFPVGVGGKGNAGVSGVVGSTNGSIAYIAASYILAHGFQVAALQNNAGNYEYPNIPNISAAAAAFKTVPSTGIHIVDPPKSAKLAYPLSTYTYVIVPKSSPTAAALQKFIAYAIGGGQSFAGPLDFAPLPKPVLTADDKSIREIGS